MKILFIACYSPLINNSASIETLQYLNNLSTENEIDLLTVNFPKNSIYYDEDILSMLNKNIKLHIISGGTVFEKIMPKKNYNHENISTISNSNNDFIKKMLKKIKGVIAIPDMYLNWAMKASKYGIKLMEENKYDVIFSMHEPPSSHICAMKIKEKFNSVPWVTYWSDPWLKDSTREGISSLRKYIEGRWERRVVELSDRFIFVTKENRNDYIKSYNIPEKKCFILTRGYDKDSYEKIKKEGKPLKIIDDKINIVYAGEIFSKLRDVNPFIDALNELEKEDFELYNKLNILFFGNIDDINTKDRLVKVNNVKVSSRIPYKEAISYMLNSEILLLFGNKNSKQIPAKIYDYFGADGKVFVILGDKKDPIKEIIKNKSKCIVVENSKEQIKQRLKKLVKEIEVNGIDKPIEEYEWRSISKKLNDILKG